MVNTVLKANYTKGHCGLEEFVRLVSNLFFLTQTNPVV